MIDWSKYFDHIVCLRYAGRPDKKESTIDELKRVGIYNSGIFSFHTNISGPLIDRMQASLPLHDAYAAYWKIPGYTNTMLGHYWILKQMQLEKCDRFLVLEDDIMFLKDFDKVLTILDRSPKDADIILYDYVQWHASSDHTRLGEFTKSPPGIFHNATAYTMSARYRDEYIGILERQFVAVDDLYNYIDKSKYNFYISNVNMCIHKPFGEVNTCHTNDDLYASMKLDISMYNSRK